MFEYELISTINDEYVHLNLSDYLHKLNLTAITDKYVNSQPTNFFDNVMSDTVLDGIRFINNYRYEYVNSEDILLNCPVTGCNMYDNCIISTSGILMHRKMFGIDFKYSCGTYLSDYGSELESKKLINMTKHNNIFELFNKSKAESDFDLFISDHTFEKKDSIDIKDVKQHLIQHKKIDLQIIKYPSMHYAINYEYFAKKHKIQHTISNSDENTYQFSYNIKILI